MGLLGENLSSYRTQKDLSSNPYGYEDYDLSQPATGEYIAPAGSVLETPVLPQQPIEEQFHGPIQVPETSSEKDQPLTSVVDAIVNLETSVVSRLDRIIKNTDTTPQFVPRRTDYIKNVDSQNIRNYAWGKECF